MKKTILATAVAVVISQPTFAAEPSYAETSYEQKKYEETNSGTYWGVGIGTALGAIVGGPAGAAAGAALGGSIGWGADKDDALEQAELTLEQNENDLVAAKGELKKSYIEMQRVRARINGLERDNALKSASIAELQAADRAEKAHAKVLESIAKHYSHEVYYRHNSSSIPDYAKERIGELISFMNEHPSLTIHLKGHTDLIGGEDANKALAQSRVDAIKDYLIEQGVSEGRIATTAFGEQFATVTRGDASNYILDRRVSLSLEMPGSATQVLSDTSETAISDVSELEQSPESLPVFAKGEAR